MKNTHGNIAFRYDNKATQTSWSPNPSAVASEGIVHVKEKEYFESLSIMAWNTVSFGVLPYISLEFTGLFDYAPER